MDIEANIRLVQQASPETLRDLYAWLSREDELRGRVRLRSGRPEPDEMGAVADVIVAVVAGGGLTALGRSLTVWLRQLRSDVTIEITGPDGRTARVDAKRVRDAETLIHGVLDPDGTTGHHGTAELGDGRST